MNKVMIATVEQIEKRTEKAVYVDFCERKVWLPVSQLTVDDNGLVWCAYWLAKKNGITPSQQYRSCFVG